jgi:hypothetical protein
MPAQSVVGPQQHFLSTYQHTFVRWSAIDMAAELNGTAGALAPAPQPLERPITPPSDHEPERPTTPTQAVPVPGQPRKTPGRTRHGVAAPETAPEEVEDAMEGVTSSRDPTPRAPTPTDEIAVVKAAATPAAPSATVALGLRPRARPLSAITDNRIVNRNRSVTPPGTSSASTGSGSGVTRSKAARNLGTLFETMAAEAGSGDAAGAPTSGERYNLRREPTAARPLATATGRTATALRPPPPQHATTSPSRLPQRVPAKRRTASRSGTSVLAQPAAAASVAPTVATTKLTRNVRRRRSSMGAADVLA